MSEKNIPFDLMIPIKIKDQIKSELTRRNIPYDDFCEWCGIDKFHFYNNKVEDGRTIVLMRKMMKFIKSIDPSFDLDYYNETHLIHQLINKCAELGYKSRQVCREIKVPTRSLYHFSGPETKTIDFLRNAVIYFNI